MKKLLSFLFVAALPLSMAGTASAALISVDWQTAGDGLLTRDTETGLEWLDLTETTNYSYNTMLGLLGAGDPFEGFRYATQTDVDSLQVGAGLPTGTFRTTFSVYRSRIETLIDLVGATQVSDSYRFAYGLTGDAFEPTTSTDDRRMRGFTLTSAASTMHGVVGDDVASASIGSWLIRDVQAASVPEPGSLAMLAMGLAGLGFAKRKKASP